MGDFNVEPSSELITNLKQTLDDSKEKAKTIFGSNGTFNGFKFDELVTRRIDYIMLSNVNAAMYLRKSPKSYRNSWKMQEKSRLWGLGGSGGHCYCKFEYKSGPKAP